MNYDERMSDTLSKWERISKGASTREMKLQFKVYYFTNTLFLFNEKIVLRRNFL